MAGLSSMSRLIVRSLVARLCPRHRLNPLLLQSWHEGAHPREGYAWAGAVSDPVLARVLSALGLVDELGLVRHICLSHGHWLRLGHSLRLRCRHGLRGWRRLRLDRRDARGGRLMGDLFVPVELLPAHSHPEVA